jgi:hypothetical protein
MMLREKLMREHPEDVGPQYVGGANGCPYEFGYAEAGCPPTYNPTDSACTECWNREYIPRVIADPVPDQTAKADEGKPRLSLVPPQIIRDIARVREYGNRKYHDPENWRTVEVERYRDAAFRHLLAYIEDPHGDDTESGLPHLWHLACNIAFLCELEKEALK